MSVEPDAMAYLSSLSIEAIARADRVRQLIGDSHWGHDGALKESVLADALTPYLPVNYSLRTGFVVDPLTLRCSREQDLLLSQLDREPPIFSSRQTAISPPRPVRMLISVKSRFQRGEFLDSADSIASGKRVCFAATEATPFGVMFFFADPEIKDRTIQKWVSEIRDREGVEFLPDLVVSVGDFSLTRKGHQYVARRTACKLGMALTVSHMLSVVSGSPITEFGELVDSVLEDAKTSKSISYFGIADGPMNEKPTKK